MKYLIGFISLSLLQILSGFAQTDKNFGIIPAPQSITKNVGSFKIDAQTVIYTDKW